MQRRRFLQGAAASVGAAASAAAMVSAGAAVDRLPPARSRVRPGDADWPGPDDWSALGRRVGGRLVAVASPWAACREAPEGSGCRDLLRLLKNPYATRDALALTQSLGWVDAWTSSPSVWAVVAETTADVVAAVDFARRKRLRLVVKGGAHSYQGTSNAADSLLVWTRRMNGIRLHDAFVAAGSEGEATAPPRAVSIGAGAIWAEAYDAVTNRAGAYVQGGGCLTVGVAGLVQSGGFGNFSKAFGLAAASLLEAEVVTADGNVRIASAHSHPELFWGLKGGGGGSLGIVTRVTLKLHELPRSFGAVNLTVKARSPAAFRRLIGLTLDFCRARLLNPHWGEQIRVRPDNLLRVAMVFQGLSRGEANAVWQPFLDAVAAAPDDYRFESPPLVVTTSARGFWSSSLAERALGFMAADDRPGAPAENVFWPGDQGQAGQVLHGFDSTWLPAALLDDDSPGASTGREALADALFAASRHWGFSLHLNKGLAGAPPAVIAAARDTSMNPAVLDAFALLIMGSEEQPAYPGIAGHEPDVDAGRRHAAAIARAMAEVRRCVPSGGAYVSESNYFESKWAQSFWGANARRLQAAKARYDPEGLFFVHHGVGSERWSADGFDVRG